MIGAIFGDIVGSEFEFDNIKTKDFEFFSPKCVFTDDTVMTVAVADALMAVDGSRDEEEFKKVLIERMHYYGGLYPDVGYGGHFELWLTLGETEPYNSYGNGSAMRVSPVGWFSESLAEAENFARASAEITHSHPEGIKGAVATAGAVYLARTGADMEQIKEYVKGYYDIGLTLDEIRPDYCFDESCQETVPQAMVAFLESHSFEDAIRNAISLGGDSDTIGAITGAVAHAYYDMNEEEKWSALSYLDETLLDVVLTFEAKYMERRS